MCTFKNMVTKYKIRSNEGWADIQSALNQYHLIALLGWQDVATRYRRSRIGAFWITINITVMIGVLGLVFGTLFNQSIQDFLPYIAIGLIFWGFISTVISEGCTGFTAAEGIILQVRMPLFTHVARILWRNTIILGHNLLILPLLFILLLKPVSLTAFLAIPGFILLVVNMSWLMLILATVCARFRDMTLIAQNTMQVIFYLTPIIWSAALLPDRSGTDLLNLNPFYHLISIVREPLLGKLPTAASWIYAILLMLFGWGLTLPFFSQYRKRIPYWL
jgi:lipopolysaccharide transport system permease protein